MLEIEAKLKVAAHEPVREALRRASAEHLRTVLETNHVFDSADGSLRRRGCGLRVRSCRSPDGGAAGTTLTFKGPVQPGEFKTREEIELQIEPAERTIALLRALGFERFLLFQKRRESWRLDDATVMLDEVPRLGLYVEIEGPSAERVQRVRSVLGLADEPHIRDSYLALLARHATTPRERRGEFVFEDEGAVR
jgi:adenylate cyclase class 2